MSRPFPERRESGRVGRIPGPTGIVLRAFPPGAISVRPSPDVRTSGENRITTSRSITNPPRRRIGMPPARKHPSTGRIPIHGDTPLLLLALLAILPASAPAPTGTRPDLTCICPCFSRLDPARPRIRSNFTCARSRVPLHWSQLHVRSIRSPRALVATSPEFDPASPRIGMNFTRFPPCHAHLPARRTLGSTPGRHGWFQPGVGRARFGLAAGEMPTPSSKPVPRKGSGSV